MTAKLPLTENVLVPLAKRVSVQLGFSAASSATDTAIQGKMFQTGISAVLK